MSVEAAAPARPSRDLRVFISTRDSRCDECGEDLGRRAWIFLAGERGALCLTCADLDHLVFLPSGDAALTRRARKESKLAVIVLKWSRARKQYERQGLSPAMRTRGGTVTITMATPARKCLPNIE